MIYITGENDTLKDLYQKVEYPTPFPIFEQNFARANPEFCLKNPRYRFILPRFTPIYLITIPRLFCDPEIEKTVKELSAYSTEELMVLKLFQESGQRLEIPVLMCVIQEKYEKRRQELESGQCMIDEPQQSMMDTTPQVEKKKRWTSVESEWMQEMAKKGNAHNPKPPPPTPPTPYTKWGETLDMISKMIERGGGALKYGALEILNRLSSYKVPDDLYESASILNKLTDLRKKLKIKYIGKGDEANQFRQMVNEMIKRTAKDQLDILQRHLPSEAKAIISNKAFDRLLKSTEKFLYGKHTDWLKARINLASIGNLNNYGISTLRQLLRAMSHAVLKLAPALEGKPELVPKMLNPNYATMLAKLPKYLQEKLVNYSLKYWQHLSAKELLGKGLAHGLKVVATGVKFLPFASIPIDVRDNMKKTEALHGEVDIDEAYATGIASAMVSGLSFGIQLLGTEACIGGLMGIATAEYGAALLTSALAVNPLVGLGFLIIGSLVFVFLGDTLKEKWTPAIKEIIKTPVIHDFIHNHPLYSVVGI